MWPMRLLLACALCLQGAAAQVTGCSVTNLTQVVGTRAAIGAPCAGQAEVDVGTVCPFTSAGETCHPVTCSSTAPVGVSWDLPTTVCYAGGCTMSALDLSDVQTAGGVGTSMLCRTASGAVSDGTMCRFTVAGGVQQCEATQVCRRCVDHPQSEVLPTRRLLLGLLCTGRPCMGRRPRHPTTTGPWCPLGRA